MVRPITWLNTTGATSGAGTAHSFGPPRFNPDFSLVRVTRSLVLYICFVDRCLSFCIYSFGHLYCLSLYDLWILITPLVSSNSSFGQSYGLSKIYSLMKYAFSKLCDCE